jgi:hypothetical protein
LEEQIVASSERLPPQQRAIALSAAGFILISNGDQAKAETLFGQNLPLYRQLSDKLGVVLTATVLGVLGYFAALRRDYPRHRPARPEPGPAARSMRRRPHRIRPPETPADRRRGG